ncbi:hypothetical protein KKF84_07940 [Myxococcota bacterium]|nr:hypothetical protein [Myxococcota bacterium]
MKTVTGRAVIVGGYNAQPASTPLIPDADEVPYYPTVTVDGSRVTLPDPFFITMSYSQEFRSALRNFTVPEKVPCASWAVYPRPLPKGVSVVPKRIKYAGASRVSVPCLNLQVSGLLALLRTLKVIHQTLV